MKIVITTPTGHVGSRVVPLLLQAGVRPTLLARDPARLPAAVRERADVVRCDQGDGDAVVRATAGADALFWVNPPTDAEDPVEGYARMGAHAARAVRENGIARTVFLSSGGAELRSGAGEIDGLGRTEEMLDATGAHVLHLRCGFFHTNLLFEVETLRTEGVLRTTLPLDHAMPWVDPRDIGDVVAARLLSTDWTGRQTQGVHGPADLTYTEVARILTEVLGRPVRAEHVGDDEVRERLRAAGLGEKQIEGVVGMSVWMREGHPVEDPRSVLTTTPTTLASWAWENLRPLLAASG
ncbi:NmrA family NAD(P)-binding protein [Streptomyces albus]|uniref:NmrA family NAD(P)-binding protein n=1 Tax=Streptomyces sp. NRRL F-5639 TaxID=1463867 RepID=UPI0004CB3F26|nr:NAD(P)H-binding protein [Streptomyces sp. NRRL F-5639]